MTVRRLKLGRHCALLCATPLLATSTAYAQGSATNQLLGQPISMVMVLALVGLLPFAFMALTSFVKISTVLQITKSALGAQSVPSTTVIMALSAALTVIAMAPVGTKIAERLEPVFSGKSTQTTQFVGEILEGTAEPMREFLHKNAAKRELARFFKLAKKTRPKDQRDGVTQKDFAVIVPAFMVTELIEAFALGFAIFLPFLIIDLVVGNVLLALGMQMMSPTQVSLPFKLLLFVGADGWGLLAQALITGYQS